MNDFSILNQENPLRIGITTLDELEEKVKAFRIINFSALKKRYILSREDVFLPDSNEKILEKGKEIDILKVKTLRKYFDRNKVFKTFQPDEGIILISDMNYKSGIPFTMDLMAHLMSIGKGIYEGFIDRVNNFDECLSLLKKTLYPKLMIIGYLSVGDLEIENVNLIRIRRIDHYIRIMEVSHTKYKPFSYFPKIKQIHIEDTQESWNQFILKVIQEYNRNYIIDES